jgi:hypothetical protein
MNAEDDYERTLTLNDCNVAPDRTITSSTFDCSNMKSETEDEIEL